VGLSLCMCDSGADYIFVDDCLIVVLHKPTTQKNPCSLHAFSIRFEAALNKVSSHI
jgi:hypothetical protein